MTDEVIKLVSIGMLGWGLGFFSGCVYTVVRGWAQNQ
jgi:hypothetical protein